jgi:peptidoglycan/LPS O-acetylase OafA/YrhL
VKLPGWSRDPRLALLSLAAAALLTESRDAYWINLAAYPLWALGCFALLNAAVDVEVRQGQLPRPALWLAGIGTFSYSLYLTHTLVLDHLARALALGFAVPPTPVLRLTLVPVCLLAAWGYYQVVERRFLNRPSVR